MNRGLRCGHFVQSSQRDNGSPVAPRRHWIGGFVNRGLKPTVTFGGRSATKTNRRFATTANTRLRVVLLPQQHGLLRVVLPVELGGEFGGGVGALGAVGVQGDVDDLVFDAGAASVVAPQEKQHGAEAEPVVAGQPREQQAQPAVRLHVEPDRAVAVLPTQEAAAVGMPLRGVAQPLAEQTAVLSVSATDETARSVAFL